MYDGAGVNGRKKIRFSGKQQKYLFSVVRTCTIVPTRIWTGHEYGWLRTGNELPSSIFEFLDILIKPHPVCIYGKERSHLYQLSVGYFKHKK